MTAGGAAVHIICVMLDSLPHFILHLLFLSLFSFSKETKVADLKVFSSETTITDLG